MISARFIVFYVLCAVSITINTGIANQYPPNEDYGSKGEFLWKRGTEFGRTANLTNVGPFLVNLPEAPGSSGVGLANNKVTYHDSVWDLSDLFNPKKVHEFDTLGMPILAHAAVIRFSDKGPRLSARNSGDIGFNQYGKAINDRLILDRISWPNGIFSYSQMTSPFYVRNYWSYDLNRKGVFAIHDPSQLMELPAPDTYVYTEGPLLELFGSDRVGVWLGKPLVYWNHFEVADVTGFSAFLGHYMVMASDQLSTGLAIYDVSGVREGRVPRLTSVFQPELTEPDGNPIGIGGYWVEPYGATKMVFAARRSSSVGRNFPALYVVDFEDPVNPKLTCEIYFDQDKDSNTPNSRDGDSSSDPMYVNFQDEYIYVDHFQVDLKKCEDNYSSNNPITGQLFNEIVYTFNDIANSCDASQYFRPIGQVGIFGGYDWWRTPDVNEQGMCGFVTSDEPDTRAPFVSGHQPLSNHQDYPIDGFVHIHVPETLRTETVENAVTITNTATNQSVSYRQILTHTGMISIFPDQYFDPNSEYLVEVKGIQDFMGNTMEDYQFTFTTGTSDLLQGETPFPEFDYVNPPPPAIVKTSQPNAPTGPAETYSGQAYFPNQSGPIACYPESESGNIWTVNQDNHSISIISSSINAVSMQKTHELVDELHFLYETPTSITRLDSQYAITFRDDDKVLFVDINGEPIRSVDTGHGSQPVSSVSDGEFLYVALYGSGQLVKISLDTHRIVQRINIGPTPKAMALYNQRLLVTRYISPQDHGEIYDIDISGDMRLDRTITVNKVLVGDDIDHGAGVPNYLSGVVISADGERAYISATKANTDRGIRIGSTNSQVLDSDNTVRPMVAIIDLISNMDTNIDPTTRDNTLDLDNGADPSAISFLANPNIRVTALQGNDILVFNNMENNSQAQFDTKGAPQGMCATRRTLYVKNFTDRSVSAIDVASYLESGSLQQQTDHIVTVQNEILSPPEKRGLEVFYHSSIPEMGPEGYMSCASCHADGGHDGRTWDLTQAGEGLRNTISLNGASGTRFGRLHWSSNFDEVQDFELQMETLNGGEGLIPGKTFNDESPLEMTTAGRSADLDALAAYLSGLGKDTVKRSPHRNYGGGLTRTAVVGKAIFNKLNCQSCHSGDAFRDGLSHDVGTITYLSGSISEVRTPTLIELWDSAPYFHDGSAKTLEQVLETGEHSVNLNSKELKSLIDYLLSIDREMYIDDDAEFLAN